jgi:hypothetical protein
LRFLEEFLVVFMEFFLQPPICSCCNRGVEEKGGKVGCWTMEEEGFGGVVDVRWVGGSEPGPLL